MSSNVLRQIALPRTSIDRIATPALLVYLDRVRANCAAVVERHCGGDANRWRPHVKTAKLAPVYSIVAESGVRNFKCATTLEARVLASSLRALGVEAESDILVAYPLVGPSLIELESLQREFADLAFSVVVESAESVASIPSSLGIFVDVNPGMNRTGMPLADAEAGAAANVARAAGDRFRGVHAYDGHAANWSVGAERRAEVWKIYDRVRALVASLHADGVPCGEAITSGTPSFIDALAHPGLGAMHAESGAMHRVSPGTVVLCDARTAEQLGDDVGLAPAALVLARCVSRPGTTMATLDAGCKAISADAGNPIANVLGYEEVATALGPSEEHLPLELSDEVGRRSFERGDPFYLLPRHICPTVNMFTEAIMVESSGDDDNAFSLRVVPVGARGHAPHRDVE